jgi:hypothetical protein
MLYEMLMVIFLAISKQILIFEAKFELCNQILKHEN